MADDTKIYYFLLSSWRGAYQFTCKGVYFCYFIGRQRGNLFPRCAWRNILFRTQFSWFDHIFTTNLRKNIFVWFSYYTSPAISYFLTKFCTLFHSFLTVLYTFHTPVQSLFLHTLSFLHHDLKKQCLSDTSCFNSFHCNYISFNLKIRHIEKGILHSVNLNEMIPNFHVNRTWFYNTNYTLFFEKCKQIFILHTQ